jgi:hypothetical protein
VPHIASIHYDTPIQHSTSALQNPQTSMRLWKCSNDSTLQSSPQDLSYALSGALKPERTRRNASITDHGQYLAESLSLNMTRTLSPPDFPCLQENQPNPFTPTYDRVGSSPTMIIPTLLGGVSELSKDWSTAHISTATTTRNLSVISPTMPVEAAW